LLRRCLTVLAAVCILSAPRAVLAGLTAPLVAPIPPVPLDSLAGEAGDPLAAAREAYETAWAQRQAGEHDAAVRTAERAIETLTLQIQAAPNPGARRELLDIHSKLTGVRDASRDALQHVDKPAGDGADPDVLTATAIEDIEPQFNAEVYRYIEYFTGAGRSVFERWMIRSGRYMDLFRNVLKKEGLPPDLVHLVFVESGFNVHARSVSAAVGPWQFLRSTGRLFGLTVNQWVDERKDPEKSTVAAARYLKHLYAIFGDWPLALASYNAGEGTVLRAIKRQGTTNYWDLRLPRQTEDYVPQFMAVLAIAREPEKYGFDALQLEDPMDFDEIALRGTVDLREIARFAECEYDELRRLNPAVLKHAAPPKDGVTMLRVPRGKAEVILDRLQGGDRLAAAKVSVQHRVRRGETLSGIAAQYHVSATQLAKANDISRKRLLRQGMVLTVPAAARTLAPAEVDADDPRASTAYVPPRTIKTPASLDAESYAEGRSRHTVRRGETLEKIAAQYGVTVDDIKRWNHITTSRVRRGTRLAIRTGDAAVPSPEQLAADSARVAALKPPPARRKSRSHRSGVGAGPTITVQSGDTLGAIARRHGTTVARLKQLNGLQTSRIRAGQRLRVPA